ncbi:MAG: hypothetical protein J7493_01460 [Porphyrobacter sp.]|nr:hypothetical protein [Porphyrobacter sp.]
MLPLASETFTNAASRASATFNANGTSGTNGAISATISFNASNNTYALTTPTGSISFGPGDIDTAQSSAGGVVYVKESGSRTDSLTVTRPGTSGRITYQYVGGAFWQRTTVGSNTASGSIDSLVYGVETPSGSVPRTGSANYLVDLVGAISTADNLFSLTGQGSTSVDFSTGQVLVVGVIDMVPLLGKSAQFDGSAQLSSTSGQFSGTMSFDDFGRFDGQLSGMLFGPHAEEIGASWSVKDSTGRVAVGALLGREGNDDFGNDSFSPDPINQLANSQTFDTEEAVLRFQFDDRIGYNQQVGDLTRISSKIDPLKIRYEEVTDSYSLLAAGIFGTYDNSSQSFTGLGPATQASWDRGTQSVRGVPLSYLRAREWTNADGINGTNDYRVSHHVYGMPTAQADLVRTGTAGYRIELSGMAADGAYRNPMRISGLGDLYVDLAAGRVSGYAPLEYREAGGLSGLFPVTVLGSWRYSAELAADKNAFAGTVEMDGLGTYLGTGSGKFYGPDADEVGGVFSTSETGGGAATGYFVGYRDDTVRDPSNNGVLPLADLPGQTNLAFKYRDDIQTVADIKNISFDPVGHTYRVSFQPFGMMNPPTNIVTFSDAERDSAASTGDIDLYRTAYLTYPTVVRKLSPNASVALSYASFAEISIQLYPANKYYDAIYYAVFGNQTIQMPRTGTASYGGLAMGSVEVQASSPSGWEYDIYNVLGTSGLSVNFGAGSFVLTIDGLGGDRVYAGANRPGHDTVLFPTMEFNGLISGASMSGSDVDRSFNGSFFGPNAEEFSGVFRTNNVKPASLNLDPNQLVTVTGVAAGKKN